MSAWFHIIYNIKSWTWSKLLKSSPSIFTTMIRLWVFFLRLIPLSSRTNFIKFNRGAPVEVLWSESNFFFIPGESLIEPDELLSKSYPPRTLLANHKCKSVFNSDSPRINPVWKASRWTPMKFWVLWSKFIILPRTRLVHAWFLSSQK